MGSLSTGLSLLAPLDDAVLFCFFLLGLGGLPLYIKHLRAVFSAKAKWPALALGAVLVFCLVYISGRTAFKVISDNVYDSNFYHLPLVAWLNNYPQVTGLALLNSHFGFCTSQLSFAAIIDNFIWDGRSAWLITGLVQLLTAFYFIYEIFYPRTNWSRFYALAFIPLMAVIWLNSHHLNIIYGLSPSLYYDFFPQIALAVAMLELLIIVLSRPPKILPKLIIIMILLAFSFLVKPIAGAALIFASGFALYFLWWARQLSLANTLKKFALPALAGCIWLLHNAVTSGYLLFPLPKLALNVDWLLSEVAAVHTYKGILSWARMPGSALGFRALAEPVSFWFGYWLHHASQGQPFWMAVISLGLGIALFIWSFWRKVPRLARFFMLCPLSCLIYWFQTAPDLRFGLFLFWVFLACAVSLICYSVGRVSLTLPFKKLLAGLAVMLCCLGIVYEVYTVAVSSDHALLLTATHPVFPTREVILLNTAGEPITVHESLGLFCGNAAPPCMPLWPLQNWAGIKMRGLRIEDGFKQAEPAKAD